MDIQLINYVDQLLLAFYKEPNGQDLKKQIRSSANALTVREIEVLKLLNKGWTNKDIAEALVVTVGTVKVRLFNIYKKLNVKNRGQAAVRAREWEILKKTKLAYQKNKK